MLTWIRTNLIIDVEMGSTTDPAPTSASATSTSEVAGTRDADVTTSTSVLQFDTSLSVHDWVKMGLSVNVDLQLLNQLCSTTVVVAVATYVVYWSIKYGKDYLALLHRYCTQRRRRRKVIPSRGALLFLDQI